MAIVFLFIVVPFILIVAANVADCKAPRNELDFEAERHAYLEEFYDF